MNGRASAIAECMVNVRGYLATISEPGVLKVTHIASGQAMYCPVEDYNDVLRILDLLFEGQRVHVYKSDGDEGKVELFILVLDSEEDDDGDS